MMKALDLVLVAALVAAPFAVSFGHSNNTSVLGHHGNNPMPYVQLLGAASPFTVDEWSLIHAVDSDLAKTLAQVMTPLSNCGDEAVRICGEGEVCWVCVTGNHNQSCGYACRASDGSCQPTPPCVLVDAAY